MTPDVRVVRGRPDDVELAALVAGLAAGTAAGGTTTAAGPHDDVATAERRRWRHAGTPLADGARPGADAWRWSLRA